MAERWVLNASPLIVLARGGYEGLIFDLADEVALPRPVAAEIGAGPEDDAARRLLAAGRIPLVDVPPSPPELLAWDLGVGETAVLAYALVNPGWRAVLDDRAARRCAKAFSIPLQGTLAVVLLARQRSLIPSAASVIRALQTGGFRLKDELIREVLRDTVSEEWE